MQEERELEECKSGTRERTEEEADRTSFFYHIIKLHVLPVKALERTWYFVVILCL